MSSTTNRTPCVKYNKHNTLCHLTTNATPLSFITNTTPCVKYNKHNTLCHLTTNATPLSFITNTTPCVILQQTWHQTLHPVSSIHGATNTFKKSFAKGRNISRTAVPVIHFLEMLIYSLKCPEYIFYNGRINKFLPGRQGPGKADDRNSRCRGSSGCSYCLHSMQLSPEHKITQSERKMEGGERAWERRGRGMDVGFQIVPIRLSETCQNWSGQVKCPYMVIRQTSQFFDRNLKLGLLKSRRDSWQCGTSNADTVEDDVSLAGVLHVAVGRAVCCVFGVFGR